MRCCSVFAALALALVACLNAASASTPFLSGGLEGRLSSATTVAQDGCGCGCTNGCGSCGCSGEADPPPTDTPIKLELAPTTTTFTVVNNGISAYTINGVNNPTLTLMRGSTYTFNITASGHPFDIKTAQSTGTANRFTNGVTGNGTTSGTLTFAVPLDAPNQLFYDCEIHIAMNGIINVIPEPGTLALLVVGLGALAGRRRFVRSRAASYD